MHINNIGSAIDLFINMCSSCIVFCSIKIAFCLFKVLCMFNKHPIKQTENKLNFLNITSIILYITVNVLYLK